MKPAGAFGGWNRRVAWTVGAALAAAAGGAVASCATTNHETSNFDSGTLDLFREAGTTLEASGDSQGSLVFEGGLVFQHQDASIPQEQEAGPQGESGAPPVFTGPLAGPFTDFPATPVLDMSDDGGAAVPTNVATLFGSSDAGAASGGPCLIEPEVGALYPNNWLRPRFVWTTPSETIFELRLHVQNQANDLVVYTTQNGWTMPKAMWVALASHSQDVPMTVSVRGGILNGTTITNEALGSSGNLGIAPVGAPGSIVFWAVVGNSESGASLLQGFSIGDENVGNVLLPSQVQERGANAPPCIGCHAATPDGLNVGFSLGYNEGAPGAYTDSIATLGVDAAPGLVPTFLTADGKAAMDALGGIPAYSPAHWSTGDRIVLLSDVGMALNWVNLEGAGAMASGVVARTGDTGLVTDPTWSHDGTTIVYTSAGSVFNGRQAGGSMTLYSVPYNNGAGGAATPIPGSAITGMAAYYPAFSPDDKYIVYNSAPMGDDPYADWEDQLYLVPAAGAPSGAPLRLSSNDPPMCTYKVSPGVQNSWAKWSPSAQYVPALGNTYYWYVFSSARYPVGSAEGNPQLYISALVVDSTGNVTSYPSLYLWNQPPDQSNHTPSWNYFQIPAPPPVTYIPPIPPSVPK